MVNHFKCQFNLCELIIGLFIFGGISMILLGVYFQDKQLEVVTCNLWYISPECMYKCNYLNQVCYLNGSNYNDYRHIQDCNDYVTIYYSKSQMGYMNNLTAISTTEDDTSSFRLTNVDNDTMCSDFITSDYNRQNSVLFYIMGSVLVVLSITCILNLSACHVFKISVMGCKCYHDRNSSASSITLSPFHYTPRVYIPSAVYPNYETTSSTPVPNFTNV